MRGPFILPDTESREDNLEKHEVTALEAYIQRRTLPLLTDQTTNGDVALLGTSTLLDIADKLFIVTAAHVFENVDLSKVAVPEQPNRANVWTLGGLTRLRPYNPHFDVEILQVHDSETLHRLRSGWDWITPDAFAPASPSGQFVLSGFPAELTEPIPRYLAGTLLSIYTGRVPDFPPEADPPCYPGVDIFFLCDDSYTTIGGPPRQMPKLQGTSGASVWEVYDPRPGDVWSPQTALSVVGVQSAYRAGKYFRAKGWQLVLQTLMESDHADVQAAASEALTRVNQSHDSSRAL